MRTFGTTGQVPAPLSASRPSSLLNKRSGWCFPLGQTCKRCLYIMQSKYNINLAAPCFGYIRASASTQWCHSEFSSWLSWALNQAWGAEVKIQPPWPWVGVGSWRAVGTGTGWGLLPPHRALPFQAVTSWSFISWCQLQTVTLFLTHHLCFFLFFCLFLVVGKMKIMKNFCQLEKPP